MMLEFYNQEYLPSLTKILTTLGTQCTCITGTDVQLLTQKVLAALLAADMLFVCPVDAIRYSMYLLYWYRNTTTDAEGTGCSTSCFTSC